MVRITPVLERELARLANKFGGGWRVEHGVMPVIVLTLTEAQQLEERLVPERSQTGREDTR